MYSLKCEWLPYDDNYSYPLLNAYPEYQAESLLTFHVKLPKRIAICLSCKKLNTEIQAILLKKQMYLSPVFIHYSLGRNSESSSIYIEYRTLIGIMNFSKNM